MQLPDAPAVADRPPNVPGRVFTADRPQILAGAEFKFARILPLHEE